MKKLTILFALLICVGLTAQTGYGQNSNQDDKETLIKAARFLEAKPFDKDAKRIRGWAISYVIQTKDVSVIVCGGDLTKAALEKKNKYGSEFVGQYTIGMAAFKLENPDKKDDENAAQLAGIESMIRAYETMLKEKSNAKFAGMDELVSKRDRGELKAIVDAADCGKK